MALIILIQKDLRLRDNPALFYASQRDLPLIPVYVREARLGSAAAWWLSQSLKSFANELEQHNLPLLYHEGSISELLEKLQTHISIDGIYYNGLDQDDSCLKDAKKFYLNLLYAPEKINRPFKIFSAFWRHCLQNCELPFPPLPKPLFKPVHVPNLPLNLFQEYPRPKGPNWWGGMEKFWEPGEEGAQKRWHFFKNTHLETYDQTRDFLIPNHTSLLSPHLRFGEISIRQIWQDLQNQFPSRGAEKFSNELGWREFAYNLLFHNKNLSEHPLNSKFSHFPWNGDKNSLERWQKGQTGYPIIDAAMRQLWQLGWMNNRLRMLTASFLTKNLRIPWQWGEKWFFDTLVDGDEAINPTNWQWVAGCGTDSAPYFRIFNPLLQGKKFDPSGDYIRQWVPELAKVDTQFIHEPWLSQSSTCPAPMVDLKLSRQLALKSFEELKNSV